MALSLLDFVFRFGDIPLLFLLVFVVIRRLYDIGASGWYAILVMFFPPIGLTVLGCLPSKKIS